MTGNTFQCFGSPKCMPRSSNCNNKGLQFTSLFLVYEYWPNYYQGTYHTDKAVLHSFNQWTWEFYISWARQRQQKQILILKTQGYMKDGQDPTLLCYCTNLVLCLTIYHLLWLKYAKEKAHILGGLSYDDVDISSFWKRIWGIKVDHGREE